MQYEARAAWGRLMQPQGGHWRTSRDVIRSEQIGLIESMLCLINRSTRKIILKNIFKKIRFFLHFFNP